MMNLSSLNVALLTHEEQVEIEGGFIAETALILGGIAALAAIGEGLYNLGHYVGSHIAHNTKH